jgi:hypothetical protein
MSDDINVSWIIYVLKIVLVKLSLCYIQSICLRPSCPFARPSSTAHWVLLDAWTSHWTSLPSYITFQVPQTIIFSPPSFLKHFLLTYFQSCVVLNTSWSHHLQFDCRQGRAPLSCPHISPSYHPMIFLLCPETGSSMVLRYVCKVLPHYTL